MTSRLSVTALPLGIRVTFALMTTGPDARRLGIDRALEDLLAKWTRADDQPVETDDPDGLARYDKDQA